jgi:hypothetical protein
MRLNYFIFGTQGFLQTALERKTITIINFNSAKAKSNAKTDVADACVRLHITAPAPEDHANKLAKRKPSAPKSKGTRVLGSEKDAAVEKYMAEGPSSDDAACTRMTEIQNERTSRGMSVCNICWFEHLYILTSSLGCFS